MIAIAEVDRPTRAGRVRRSLKRRYRILTDPIYATRNGKQYVLMGVRSRA